MTLPSMIRFAPFTQSVVTSVPKSPTSGERVRNIWITIERLTEQKDFDPFKDSPLEEEGDEGAEEGQGGPTLGHLHRFVLKVMCV